MRSSWPSGRWTPALRRRRSRAGASGGDASEEVDPSPVRMSARCRDRESGSGRARRCTSMPDALAWSRAAVAGRVARLGRRPRQPRGTLVNCLQIGIFTDCPISGRRAWRRIDGHDRRGPTGVCGTVPDGSASRLPRCRGAPGGRNRRGRRDARLRDRPGRRSRTLRRPGGAGGTRPYPWLIRGGWWGGGAATDVSAPEMTKGAGTEVPTPFRASKEARAIRRPGASGSGDASCTGTGSRRRGPRCPRPYARWSGSRWCRRPG